VGLFFSMTTEFYRSIHARVEDSRYPTSSETAYSEFHELLGEAIEAMGAHFESALDRFESPAYRATMQSFYDDLSEDMLLFKEVDAALTVLRQEPPSEPDRAGVAGVDEEQMAKDVGSSLKKLIPDRLLPPWLKDIPNELPSFLKFA
jgi:hypothetical protein